MNKISTTTFVLLAGLIVIGSIYFLYLHDETTTQFQSCGSSESTLDIFDTLAATTCTPDSGYDICYQYDNGPALAQIQSTNWQGKKGYGFIDGANRHYYIDEVYVNVKHKGDYFYTSSSSTWTSCGSSGCVGTKISDGKHILATAPASFISNIQFTAWDKFTSASTGQWWWASKSFGWISGPYQYYVIDCYDNSDVPAGYFCDKSGSWDTWTAEIDKCIGINTPNICDGFDLYSQSCNQNTGYVSQSNLIESNSATCGYVCQVGDTQSITCTDGSTAINTICENNQWIINDKYPEQSCPLNWDNIDMILSSYIDQITTIIKGIVS